MPLQTAKQELANFNNTYFSLKNLTISSFLIDNKRQMITISKFDNKEDAMDYYSILMNYDAFEPELDEGIIEVYAMSANNYTSFYNKRDNRNDYPEFFKDNYLNNQ